MYECQLIHGQKTTHGAGDSKSSTNNCVMQFNALAVTFICFYEVILFEVVQFDDRLFRTYWRSGSR